MSVTDRCDFSWNEYRIERLKCLTDDGLSASQIADKLFEEFRERVTRSAIIGKTYRLGIKLRGSSTNRLGASRHYKPKANGKTIKVLETPKPPPELVMPTGDAGITLAELDLVWQCRWPMGDERQLPFRYCGKPRLYPGTSTYCYCPHHHRIAYHPAPRRR